MLYTTAGYIKLIQYDILVSICSRFVRVVISWSKTEINECGTR